MNQITPDILETIYSYRDFGNEVDHLEYNWQRYAETDNSNVLDIACGTGGHLQQFQAKGYNCEGIDLDTDVIDFARNKFSCDEPAVAIHQADMIDFKLDEKFGLAINMLNAANLITSNEKMIKHLQSVGSALESGGIYIMEMYHPREYDYASGIPTRSWEISKDKKHFQADLRYDRDEIDPLKQTQATRLKVKCLEDNAETLYEMTFETRVYLYLEIAALIQLSDCFELLNCYGTFNSSVPLDNSKRSWRMIPVMRRK